MADVSIISNTRFVYIHDNHKQAVDTHHIILRTTALKPIVTYLIAIILVAYSVYLHIEEGKPVTIVIWNAYTIYTRMMISLIVVSYTIRAYNTIFYMFVSESVIIMPEFGVQLETHYGSGKINRRFIPVSKILKPVLNERVTPVTCCWCLSFLTRNENELTLVFKKFRPPLKMLVPIWKALCVATDCKESFELQEDE
ncbi:uncharacterized protein LOC143561177 [Bidens hawaiensis]|uniref:uncharacterized protein LOC143561177 n=1 Tax=Bidens hawaiensis TaxID=980011 RepID=UPI004049D752